MRKWTMAIMALLLGCSSTGCIEETIGTAIVDALWMQVVNAIVDALGNLPAV